MRRKEGPKSFCLRGTQEQMDTIKKRAKTSNMSTNEYLIERGLSDAPVASKQEIMLRDEAVFEIKWATHELRKLFHKLDRKAEVSSEKVDEVLDHLLHAGKLLGISYDPDRALEARSEDGFRCLKRGKS
jgi:hypothetical protein